MLTLLAPRPESLWDESLPLEFPDTLGGLHVAFLLREESRVGPS